MTITDDEREARERQLDRQYWAGAKAAWNAAQSDNPREAFEAIQRAYTGLPEAK